MKSHLCDYFHDTITAMTQEQQKALIQKGREFIGRPYKYGATSDEAPQVFDCSSFTQYLFKQIGTIIPRSTIEQATQGVTVQLKSIELGDLIFFHGSRGHYNPTFPQGIGHVVLYIGDNKIIHAGSRRIQEQPNIIEVGGVEELDFKEVVEKLGPIIVIKRII